MRTLFASVLFIAVSCCGAATIYNESVSGDLSNSGLTPTVLPVSLGSNQIIGTTGRVTATDRDYFTINVQPGLQISSIIEQAGTTVGDAVSFFGIQTGTQVTLPVTATTANGLLGWTHYGPVSTDTDILPDLGIPSLGSTGFNGPLPAGNYAFWIQDFGAGTFAYSFDVRLTATPEPSSLALGMLGLSMAVIIGRKRFHRG